MPGKVAVKIKAGRNLPVMDRSSDTTDAYVEIKLGTVTQKTDVFRKSLNPQWNTDWFRFEVDDAELQDEPLQIRLMDHDTYSANDAIGKVNISLNSLCLETGQPTHGKGTVLSGWIPVFDTMHGIRGEVNVIVKVDLFSDVNKFRQSSCGIPFFHSQCVPFGYRAQVIHGFVEELVVNDDPEYAWIDKIRTPRASNEARQVVFLKLSGQVQRKMGLKAINMGANAVIGYTQCFDLEGDVGVVARGIGTAVTLIKDASIGGSQAGVAAADNALVEERTAKYLEFLTGSGICEQPQYNLHISQTDASPLYDLKCLSNAEVPPDGSSMLMQGLMRQEDERGEKPSRKLKHRMRRFGHSSRSLFNDKYNAFMRRINDNADTTRSTSRSLSSLLLLGNSIKEEHNAGSDSASSTHSSAVSKLSLKRTKHKLKATATLPIAMPFQRSTSHPIVRSVSDDSAMKKHDSAGSAADADMMPDSDAMSQFQDSTRSSPNIVGVGIAGAVPSVVARRHNQRQPFGQFSKHDTHLRHAPTQISSSSSMTTSPLLSGEEDDDSSSSSTSEDEDAVESSVLELTVQASEVATLTAEALYGSEERAKVERMLRMCNLNEDDAAQNAHNWIHPGQQPDDETSCPELPERRSLLRDLKCFSHHIQDFMHKPKKHLSFDPCLPSASTSSSYGKRRMPPSSLPLRYQSAERKCYYSSQPEIFNSAPEHSSWPVRLARLPLRRSSSLNQLNVKRMATTNTLLLAAFPLLTAAVTPPQQAMPRHNCPIFQICPSTPTPSEAEQVGGSNPENTTCDSVSISFAANPNTWSTPVTSVPPKPKRPATPLLFTLSNSSSRCSSNSKLTNINSSLLAPSIVMSDQLPTTTAPASHHSNHTPHEPQQQQYHRSLNELSGNSTSGGGGIGGSVTSSAITDSPCLKRHTTPAAAAIVACANATVNNTSGNLHGSRGKLTPSPSKIAMMTDNGNNNITMTPRAQAATPTMSKETSEMCRRSSDSDLSVTPKGNSICVASERLVAATAMMRLNQISSGKTANATDNLDMLEYPFLTMTKYPQGFILHLGATVAARSVKLLERVPNPDEPEVRDSWWTELRMEIRSHARALCCNVVLGYSESTTISDDVCVLSATGTAAVINMAYNRSVSQTDIFTISKSSMSAGISTSLEERDILKDTLPRETLASTSLGPTIAGGVPTSASKKTAATAATAPAQAPTPSRSACNICHIPYSLASVPFNVKMKRCAICRKGRVPDVLMATLEVPDHLSVTGRGCFMQAQVVRAKKDLRSELNAKEISDGLPFLEYELHRLLINKLKAKGMNAIFGLRAQVAIGERMIALIATGTALFLSALPVPLVPKIVAGNSWTDKQKLNELQKKLQETYERNQEIYQLKCLDPDLLPPPPGTVGAGTGNVERSSDTDESDDEIIEMDLNSGNKDTCVLEVDDIEDLEIISLLMEPYPPEGFHVVNTQVVPGMAEMEAVKNLQMFTQVWRAKLDVGQNINSFPKHFQRLLQTIYFKLRSILPCVICDLRFRLDLPESDQIQLLVTGMALGLSDSGKLKSQRRPHVDIAAANANGAGDVNGSNVAMSVDPHNGASGGNKRALQEEDYIFPLDEDQMVDTPTPTSNMPPLGSYSLKLRKTSPSRTVSKPNAHSITRHRYFPLRDRYGIDVTPLSYVPGGRIDKYLGNLNFFFIRESTCIRENGGISGFVHGFITELLAVVRAHIAALGGNAMVSFYMTELILVDNQHKNQGQCLISIGGDAVYVAYHTDD